jgi:hypothetical protein
LYYDDIVSNCIDILLKMVYSSNGQMAARGPDPASGLIYSGPRQVTGLFSQKLNFTTVMA